MEIWALRGVKARYPATNKRTFLRQVPLPKLIFTMPASQKSKKTKSRSLNLVDYIRLVLARISPDPTGQFSERALAILLLDASPDNKKKGKARQAGIDFLEGKKTATVDQVVAMISLLYQRIKHKQVIHLQRKRLLIPAPLPTSVQILRALQLCTQLTTEELEQLDLPAHAQHPLLQQAFLNLASYKGNDAVDRILEVYRASIQASTVGTGVSAGEVPLKHKPFQTLGDVHEYIDSQQGGEKIKRAIDRLLLQAATGQVRFLDIADQNQYIRDYFTRDFIDRFVQTIQTNNALTQSFPVYLKRISIESAGPFPMFIQGSNPLENPFHGGLLTLQYPDTEKTLYASSDSLFDQLPSRTVSKITCDFYIRIDKDRYGKWKDYPGFSPQVRQRMATEMQDQQRVHFSISSTGIGGTNSHATKIINTAVLNDVDCLRAEYSSMAHDDLLETKIINDKVASPVWAHSFVHLCHNDDIIQALKSSPANTIYRHDQPSSQSSIGYGDYCHFDVMTAMVKAALQARLQALYNTGISPKTYINDLLVRVEKEYILEEAETLVSSYPFSSFILESWINRELLLKEDKNSSTSYVLCKAHLLVTEVFLNEGVYRKAYPYLEWLQQKLEIIADASINWLDSYGDPAQPEPDVDPPNANNAQQGKENGKELGNLDSVENQENIQEDNFEAFSDSLLASYEICVAQYFYTLDWQRENNTDGQQYFLGKSKNANQGAMIKEAWDALERAEKHLTVRMARYHAVDEISQAAFRPYYYILAKIYLLRAKLFIWFAPLVPPKKSDYRPPIYTQTTDSSLPENFCGARLFLLERARVYAACDGNDKLYVICTAYQCWVWLMTKFLTKSGYPISLWDKRREQKPLQVKQSECLPWAKQLRNHTLLCYEPIGHHCYHEIKEKSGLSTVAAQDHADFDTYEIATVPAIQEVVGGEKPGFKMLSFAEEGQEKETAVLYLNMRYLTVKRGSVDPNNPHSTQSIYLFGPAACYLFFIRGLYHLCSDDKLEFSEQEEKAETLEEWDTKFEECYRLFNYAWAIADDGCTVDQVSQDENKLCKIERYSPKSYKHITDADAASVWDLYPLRVTEIADSGKIFAAACAALRCHTSHDYDARDAEIKELFDRLHNQLSFNNSNDFKKALAGQERYNGNLEHYLAKCRKAIQKCRKNAEIVESKVRNKRGNLLEKLFSYNALDEF